jgi:outer membrane protein W
MLGYFTKIILCIVILGLIAQKGYAQVYIEKQSRHRFAQLNLGADLHSRFGGAGKYLDMQGSTQSFSLPQSFSPRMLIGGTHFWGHADFYLAIPILNPAVNRIHNQEIQAYRGVETVFKYYPFRIQQSKIRPYLGVSFAPAVYRQNNNYFEYPQGPELQYTNFPVLGGATFLFHNHLIEAGVSWNPTATQNYYISRTQIEKIQTPPYFISLSYRYMLETTLSAEKDWESGRTQEVTKILADKGRLNGIYLGVGISSAFWLKQNEYNKTYRPYIDKYNSPTFPDFTLGFYFHKPDVNIAGGYRAYTASAHAYGALQQVNRKSLLLEATHFLFDYHGFVPFVGPALSFENLTFQEHFEGSNTLRAEADRMGYGLTFGWDIRPNRLQAWILRTNLRWFPHLRLDAAPGAHVNFENLEFNFIQLIVYPNRMIKRKPSR